MKRVAALLILALSCAVAAERLPLPYRSSLRIRSVADPTNETAQLIRMARISDAQARAIARKVVPTGVIEEVELENHRGSVVWEVEIRQDDLQVEFEIIIDAGNGEVLFITSEEETT